MSIPSYVNNAELRTWVAQMAGRCAASHSHVATRIAPIQSVQADSGDHLAAASPAPVPLTGNFTWRDDFSSAKLSPPAMW